MNNEVKQILEAVQRGEMNVDDALLRIKTEPFEDIGYAKVDLHRKVRQGAAEVIYGAGKTPEQIIGIAENDEARRAEHDPHHTAFGGSRRDRPEGARPALPCGGARRHHRRDARKERHRQNRRRHRQHERHPGFRGGRADRRCSATRLCGCTTSASPACTAFWRTRRPSCPRA